MDLIGQRRRLGAGVVAALILALTAPPAAAEPRPVAGETAEPRAGRVTGLPIPRFVTLKRGRTHVRQGPGNDHAINWTYLRAGLPVEVIAEFDIWRRVRLPDGEVGWVQQVMLTGTRGAVVTQGENAAIRRAPDAQAPVRAWAAAGLILEVESCAGAFCAVRSGRVRGHIARERLWGVYPGEDFAD